MTSATDPRSPHDRHVPHPPPGLVEVLAVPAMVGAGALVAVQSQINSDLAGSLGEGIRAGAAAAVISFGSGLVLLAVLVSALPAPRAGLRDLVAAVRRRRLPPHLLLGGTAGAMLVASQGLTIGTIGVALFTVAAVAGQTTSGIVVDRLGVGPSGRQAVSGGRLAGAALTVAAVVISVSGRLAEGVLGATALALALLPLAAGAGNAWQAAANGRVSAVSHPFAAALNNFVVGTTLLLVFLAASFLAPGDLDRLPGEWWLYLGGALSVVFITAAAWLVTVHGVLVLGLCVVAGQVVTSVLIDAVVADTRIEPATVTGSALALLGVVVGALATRRKG